MIHFPYDCVKDFLETHPVMRMSRAKPWRIHHFLSELLSHDGKCEGSNASKPATKEATKQTFSCPLCKGTQFEINHREACLTCTDCGCTETYIDPDNCMYYAEAECATRCRADSSLEYEIAAEICHWSDLPGSLVRRSGSEQKSAVREALRLKYASLTERCVSALLVTDVRKLVDLEAVKDRMRTGRELPVIAAATAPPNPYVCNGCGKPVASRYESRRHGCNWGKRKRSEV